MPGYDCERFDDLSESEKSELTCGICQSILRSPVFAQCCGQSFCKDCITEWLTKNNTCPYDRKVLKVNELPQPPRIMLNMLGKLRIHCDYRDKGCEEILVLENLSQHSLKCRYNVQNVDKCEKCSLDLQTSGHDCIKALLELNQEMKLKMKLEAEKSMTSPSTSQPVATRQWISKEELLESARMELFNENIIHNSLSDEMTHKLLIIIREELLEIKTLFTVCQNVVEKMNQEFGGHWQCMANERGCAFETYLTCEPNHGIQLSLGRLFLKIFKTKKYDLVDFIQRFKARTIKREINIIETDMNESMISYVRTITFCALEESSNWTQIMATVVPLMEKRYGGLWQCIIFFKGTFKISNQKIILFDIAGLKFVLYQRKNL